MPDLEILKWGVTQGALAVVTLIVLWYYRKDMQRIQARDEEKMSVLTDLVGDTKAAIASNTAQSAEVDRSLNRLAVALNLQDRPK